MGHAPTVQRTGLGYDPRPMSPAIRRVLPNAITLVRLGLAVVFFGVLESIDRTAPAAQIALLGAWGMGIFATAALSDILDGYLARRWNVVSAFGRLMDPLVDKVLILGGFIYLASPRFEPIPANAMIGSGIAAWMVVVILLRELLVTGLRSYIESRGIPFPADWSGKLKMFIQSFCVGCCVYVSTRVEPYGWQVFLRDASTWATVVLTVLSSITYIRRALHVPPEGRPSNDASVGAGSTAHKSREKSA
ncbi:MAG: CDP-diacylglycerol--glycerol-3-phosphate 3-phosphatidyltransferase [Planctomycetota bacterium]